MAQRPSLQPAEGDGIALVEVLGRIEHVWRTVAPQRADREDLRRRECEWLLVDVDHVPRLAHGAPERPGVVEEERRVTAERPDTLHGLALVGLKVDVAAALVPALRSQEVHVVSQFAQLTLPRAPRVYDGAVEQAEDPHAARIGGDRRPA